MAGHHIDKKTEQTTLKYSHFISFFPCFIHISSNNYYKAAEPHYKPTLRMTDMKFLLTRLGCEPQNTISKAKYETHQ
jgi:hypothetical protein